MVLKNYSLLFIFVFFVGCASRSPSSLTNENACLTMRAAIDVGSGNTKMKVAQVDQCEQKIVKIVGEIGHKVDFKEDLMRSPDGNLSDSLKQKAMTVFLSFKQLAINLDVKDTNIAGVATAALRDAKNGKEFLKEVEQTLGVRIKVISQKEEGIIGFYAAQSEIHQKDAVVWDIGGGSSQITFKDQENFHVYEGDLASVNFKNRVVREIQKRVSETPNPLKKEDATQGLKLAEKHLEQNPDLITNKKIIERDGIVFGIGGVHGESIKRQTNKQIYNLEDLEKAIESSIGKSDAEIGGKYASTDVTNLLLVKSYMITFGIKNVVVVQVNNSNGILLMPEFWPSDF